jgi:hypothetical protein
MDFWAMAQLTQGTAAAKSSAAQSSDSVTICKVLKLLCFGGDGTAATKQAWAAWEKAARVEI